MRDYQIQGLNWLISLYHNDINGILADEMVYEFLRIFVLNYVGSGENSAISLLSWILETF